MTLYIFTALRFYSNSNRIIKKHIHINCICRSLEASSLKNLLLILRLEKIIIAKVISDLKFVSGIQIFTDTVPRPIML